MNFQIHTDTLGSATSGASLTANVTMFPGIARLDLCGGASLAGPQKYGTYGYGIKTVKGAQHSIGVQIFGGSDSRLDSRVSAKF